MPVVSHPAPGTQLVKDSAHRPRSRSASFHRAIPTERVQQAGHRRHFGQHHLEHFPGRSTNAAVAAPVLPAHDGRPPRRCSNVTGIPPCPSTECRRPARPARCRHAAALHGFNRRPMRLAATGRCRRHVEELKTCWKTTRPLPMRQSHLEGASSANGWNAPGMAPWA